MKVILNLITVSAASAFMGVVSNKQSTTSLNNIGSEWAYDPFGAVYQHNFFYHADPTVDPWAGDKWYYQPWSGVSQSQFTPLKKTGLDYWYFEPRTVIPPDDEFFHGYNSASHTWIPPEVASAEAAAFPPPQQAVIPPAPEQQQLMPGQGQQMPEMDSTMAAYEQAMAQN